MNGKGAHPAAKSADAIVSPAPEEIVRPSKSKDAFAEASVSRGHGFIGASVAFDDEPSSAARVVELAFVRTPATLVRSQTRSKSALSASASAPRAQRVGATRRRTRTQWCSGGRSWGT